MKIIEFVKKEFIGYKKSEIIFFVLILGIILFNALQLKDSLIAVLSAICGISYTIFAGKGKISCYLFGLTGSFCYSYISFKQALYGNLALYILYYIPMEFLGIFHWKNNFKKDKQEIKKEKLTKKERAKFLCISFFGSIFFSVILYFLKDKNPLLDGITTFLSIIGMYFTIKRKIEQWFIWLIVNGLSFLMWLILVLQGAKTFSTLVMWGVYIILAIYFYLEWKKEIN